MITTTQDAWVKSFIEEVLQQLLWSFWICLSLEEHHFSLKYNHK